MKTLIINLFEPDDFTDNTFSKEDTTRNSYLPSLRIPVEFDFIQHFTGHGNLTHAWNRFGLKREVVEKVMGLQSYATPPECAG